MATTSMETDHMRDLLPREVPVRLPYMPGIDGLRAIAVIAVILYHAEFGFIPGGFLGVEVFLVISGYLITSLLILERLRTGSVNLKDFWLRRARRLLPALGVLLIFTVAGALLFARDALFRLNQDVLGALTYSTNWVMIFRQESYFEAFSRPPLLRHLWSLAVEEQFYLFFPLIFVGGVALLSRGSTGFGQMARRFIVVAFAGAIASTALMWLLFVPYEDPSRVYFGTDTRAAGLLIGVGLAFLWQPWRFTRRLSAAGAAIMNVIGFAALGGLIVLLLRMGEYDLFLYRGGFFVVSTLTAVVIAVTVHPQGALNPVLGNRPLVWVGKRSYGLYLYHWPVFIFLRPGIDVPWGRWPTLVVQVVLTVAIAELSYRWIEQPIRRLGFTAWFAMITNPLQRRSPQAAVLWPVVAGVFLVGLTIGLIEGSSTPSPGKETVALAEVPAIAEIADLESPADVVPVPVVSTDPESTAEQPLPAAAQSGSGDPESASSPNSTLGADPDSAAPGASTTAPVSTASERGTVEPGSEDSETTTTQPEAVEPERPAAAPAEAQVEPPTPGPVMIGDSVMLGAQPGLTLAIDEARVDAQVSRQMKQVPDVVDMLRADAPLGDVAVVHLGTNGVFSPYHFDAVMIAFEGVERVYFVNAKVPRRWEDSVNENLKTGVELWPNAYLVDWNDAATDHPEYFSEDGVHLTGAGIEAYASLIARSIGH
jgi:peptidoglycan/LPS O-acetylase OafA/YrhL